jgi:hypothetical protein
MLLEIILLTYDLIQQVLSHIIQQHQIQHKTACSETMLEYKETSSEKQEDRMKPPKYIKLNSQN